MLCALDFYLGQPNEIAIVGDPGSADTQSLLKAIWALYLPNKVVAQAAPGDTSATDAISLLRSRPQMDSKPTAYVCEQFVCKQPVTTPAELASQLLKRAATQS